MALAPRTEIRKLGDICSSLSDSIESAMHALYNLETATINAETTINVDERFRQYRPTLYQTIRASNNDGWNQIVQHLEHSAQFGREVEIFGANLSNATASELLEHAKDIATESTSLVTESKGILGDHILYLTEFTKPEKRLKAILEEAKKARITQRDFYDESIYIKTSGARQLIRETRKNMYVDGIESLDAFKKANEEMKNNIFALVEFWHEHSSACARAVDGVSDKTNTRRGLSIQEAKKMSTDWKEALPQVKDASDRILKMCDVVMTPAVGAPRTRRPHHADSRASNDANASGPNNLILGTALFTGAVFLGSAWERLKHSQVVQNAGNFFDSLGDEVAAAFVHDESQQAEHVPNARGGFNPTTSYYPATSPPRPPTFPREGYYVPRGTTAGEID